MKILGKVAIFSALSAMAAPAMACDMHGGGMHFTPASQWKSFSPRASSIDPAYLDNEDRSFLGDTSTPLDAVPPAPKARPSFSSAADRASRAAKTRIMMVGDSQKDDEASTKRPMTSEEETARNASLNTDTQAVR